MSTGKQAEQQMEQQAELPEVQQAEQVIEVMESAVVEAQEERHAIAVPPRAREELKALLRAQNEAQERVRLVLATLEEALAVPAGWVIRDVDEGFVELKVEQI